MRRSSVRPRPGGRRPARAVEAQVQAYWAEQTPDERKRLEAAAPAGAAAAARAAYAAAAAPSGGCSWSASATP